MAKGILARTEYLIKEAKAILVVESPMTLRQLFYRLVSKLIITNDRASYQRLSRVMTDARNNGDIPFSWIVDRSKPEYQVQAWRNPEAYLKAVAKSYRRDRWQDQPYYVEIWSEKDTLYGSLESVLDKYGVIFRAHRGFSSTTKKHDLGELFEEIQEERPVYVFYLGDFDPSGQDIERDLKAKTEKYGAVDFHVVRLGVQPEDIRNFNLPPLRIKDKDPRSEGFRKRYGEECVEVDALPPDELRKRVEAAICGLIDWELWERQELVEAAEVGSIRDIVGRFRDLASGESLK